jgi:hypothetical protein
MKLYGSEAPRLWTPPARVLTPRTSHGFAAAKFAEDLLGVTLIPWQRWMLEHALELRPDGRYRFRNVVVLVGRQNGKSTLIQTMALWKLFVSKAALVVGTSTNLDIAEESWMACVDIAEGVPELAREVAEVIKGSGKKQLVLSSGSRYKVQTANRRGGRGLSADLVILDELREHQHWDAWSACTKTTMARPKSQVWSLSNAGDDKSVVLNHMVEIGRANLTTESDLGFFEYSADPATDCDCGGRVTKRHSKACALRGADARRFSNPSLGYLIDESALDSALDTDPVEVYLTENLCVRVESMERPLIPKDVWFSCLDINSTIREDEEMTGRPPCLGVAVGMDRSTAAVAVAGQRADGLPHVEVIRHAGGVGWLAEYLLEMQERYGWEVVLDPAGPQGALPPLLDEAGVSYRMLSTAEYAAACLGFYDDVLANQLRHLGQPAADDVIPALRQRDVGDGGWGWGRKNSHADISPIEAETVALFGHRTGEFGSFSMYG